jgi:hypothetical protein
LGGENRFFAWGGSNGRWGINKFIHESNSFLVKIFSIFPLQSVRPVRQFLQNPGAQRCRGITKPIVKQNNGFFILPDNY